jgi:hypothetical protein
MSINPKIIFGYYDIKGSKTSLRDLGKPEPGLTGIINPT